MKIEVLENYGGQRTQERRVLPGVYDVDDPALFGVGEYLLEVGKAVVIEADAPAASDEPENSESQSLPETEAKAETPKPKRK